MKKYNVIYADPPWSYNDKMSGHSFSLDHEYKTQSIEWIKSLSVNNLADKDCALFMWVVSPLLPEALDVIKSWGFKYKTLAFCWSKYHKSGKLVKNLGRWTMGNVELCLLATRGKPKRICNNIQQLVQYERSRHSVKPPIVRDRIVQLMGDVPRIELFARERERGWDALGDSIDGKDIKDVLDSWSL